MGTKEERLMGYDQLTHIWNSGDKACKKQFCGDCIYRKKAVSLSLNRIAGADLYYVCKHSTPPWYSVEYDEPACRHFNRKVETYTKDCGCKRTSR